MAAKDESKEKWLLSRSGQRPIQSRGLNLPMQAFTIQIDPDCKAKGRLGAVALICCAMLAVQLEARESWNTYDLSGNITAVTNDSDFAPTITTQPNSGLLYTNGFITLSVVASGAGVSYQWLSNGVPIGGATGDSLFLRNVTGTNFSVVISNATGVVTSTPVAIWADSNGNGIPDWWEMQYFGNLNQTAIGDFDGDGVSNLDEYREGTNPANATSYNPRRSEERHVGQEC